jgi:hypothetical protein
MDSIWMAIAPGRLFTRVIAMQGASDTILKARLRRDPPHPRALSTLLEAVALWQGTPVRAALAADDEETSCDSCLSPSAYLGAETTPLYTVDWVPAAGQRRRRRPIAGMGEFRDLERVLLCEVAR